MNLRLRLWLLWRQVRLALLDLIDPRGKQARGAKHRQIEGDPLEAIRGELLRAAERLKDDEALGIPRAGVDYEPIELTPDLEARRDRTLQELIAYQDRRQASRVRARRTRVRARIATAGAAASLMLVAAAGASALGVGVPGVDEFLDRIVAGRGDDTSTFRSAQDGEAPPRGAPDLRPAPAEPSHMLELPFPESDEKIAAVAYVSQADELCFTLVATGEAEGPVWGDVRCLSKAQIAADLAAQPVLLANINRTRATILLGFTTDEVQTISAQGPSGSFHTEISDPWTTPGAAPTRLRMFVASSNTGDQDAGGSGDLADDPRNYEFEITLSDGQALIVKPKL